MGQILIRNIDDASLAHLRERAKKLGRSVESLARDALHAAAADIVADRMALVQEMHEWSRKARVPGAKQSLGVDLIREARDHDH